MRYVLVFIVAAPVLAAAAVLLWPEPERAMGPELAPRAVGGAAILASMGASIWIALSTASDELAPTDGFLADPWRALLALGVLAGAGAWLIRRREANDVLVARLGLTGALVGAILAADGATMAAFLAAGGACTVWLAVRGHLAPRTAALVVASDVALLVATLARADTGLAAPMDLAGPSAWLWLAAIVVRATVWARTDDAGLALGYRMQSIWFAAWVVDDGARTALTIAAALLAVVAARRVARTGSASPLAAAIALLAIVAVASARADLLGATAVLAAATAVVGVLVALARAGDVVVGLAPIGAALPGVIVLATVSMRERSFDGRLVALAVVACACYLAVATGDRIVDPRVRARLGWALVPLAASIAVAAVPEAVADAFAPGSPTLTAATFPVPRLFVPAAFLAIVLGSMGSLDRTSDEVGPEIVAPGWTVTRIHLIGVGVVVALGAVMLLRGLGRGFL